MLNEQQEHMLAQGLREGKTEAWQALYDAHAEPVWRSVARLLGAGCTDVADVVQETMLAAARSANTFDPARGSLRQWLWGISHNYVALYFRTHEQQNRLAKTGARLTERQGQLPRGLEAKEPSPSAALATAEVATLVRATLVEISADYALLLTAKYLDGETVAAIALREGASEVAVRSKLARARQAFRQGFGKYAQDFTDRPEEAHP
jgi:RNA polymerase sigma-70 factor, ECF subfamily